MIEPEVRKRDDDEIGAKMPLLAFLTSFCRIRRGAAVKSLISWFYRFFSRQILCVGKVNQGQELLIGFLIDVKSFAASPTSASLLVNFWVNMLSLRSQQENFLTLMQKRAQRGKQRSIDQSHFDLGLFLSVPRSQTLTAISLFPDVVHQTCPHSRP